VVGERWSTCAMGGAGQRLRSERPRGSSSGAVQSFFTGSRRPADAGRARGRPLAAAAPCLRHRSRRPARSARKTAKANRRTRKQSGQHRQQHQADPSSRSPRQARRSTRGRPRPSAPRAAPAQRKAPDRRSRRIPRGPGLTEHIPRRPAMTDGGTASAHRPNEETSDPLRRPCGRGRLGRPASTALATSPAGAPRRASPGGHSDTLRAGDKPARVAGQRTAPWPCPTPNRAGHRPKPLRPDAITPAPPTPTPPGHPRRPHSKPLRSPQLSFTRAGLVTSLHPGTTNTPVPSAPGS
jgi:hypothetical protein